MSLWKEHPESLDMLRTMYLAGSTATEIMNKLNAEFKAWVSRNAVCGKIDRLSLPARATPQLIAARREARDQKKIKAEARREDGRKRAAEGRELVKKLNRVPGVAGSVTARLTLIDHWSAGLAPNARNLSLLALGAGDCRWPVGEATGRHQLFCGCPRAGYSDPALGFIATGPYCPFHTKAARATSVPAVNRLERAA